MAILPPLPGNEAACSPTVTYKDADDNEFTELTIDEVMLGDITVTLDSFAGCTTGTG